MVDMVVHRHQMRETVSRIARMLMKAPEAAVSDTARWFPLTPNKILARSDAILNAAAGAASQDHRSQP